MGDITPNKTKVKFIAPHPMIVGDHGKLTSGDVFEAGDHEMEAILQRPEHFVVVVEGATEPKPKAAK